MNELFYEFERIFAVRRDTMHRRGLWRRAVSVTFVYGIETDKNTVIVAMEYE